MIITIDEDICAKYNLTMSEVLAIALVKTGADVLLYLLILKIRRH